MVKNFEKSKGGEVELSAEERQVLYARLGQMVRRIERRDDEVARQLGWGVKSSKPKAELKAEREELKAKLAQIEEQREKVASGGDATEALRMVYGLGGQNETKGVERRAEEVQQGREEDPAVASLNGKAAGGAIDDLNPGVSGEVITEEISAEDGEAESPKWAGDITEEDMRAALTAASGDGTIEGGGDGGKFGNDEDSGFAV